MNPPPDHAVQQVDAAVALLVAYDTLAGPYVERVRLDTIPAGDMPRIVVTSDVDMRFFGMSPPQFDARLSLLVEGYAEDASRDALVAKLDTLQAQIKDALFCDPGWVRQFTRFEDVKVRWKAGAQGERYEGMVQVVITALWREIYRPRISTPLATITLAPTPGATPPTVPPAIISLPEGPSPS